MNRRAFIRRAAGALASGAAMPLASRAAALAEASTGAGARAPRVILRSSWQVVNIGDIGHTPGVLRLFEKHLPDVEVRLWPSTVDHGVEEMLLRRFPKLAIIREPGALKAAFSEGDFLLHGSGPSLVARDDVARWRQETGKPYGVYGITLGAGDPKTIEILAGARFAFFRDSVSLKQARDRGCACPVMEFGPDGAFACDLRDDARATAFLRANGLEEGRFLCCLSRLRHTPTWTLPGKNRPIDAQRHQRNEAMKEHDHRALREAIVTVVRQTGLKVLLCPEDMTQMAVGREMFLDKLPADVLPRVVWREKFWLTDEALSVYVRSAGLFGSEMHSPIMAVGNGIPAVVCRFEEQTSKGYMWRDIGLSDWLFDLDREDQHAGIVPAVLAMARDPVAARARAAKARAFVEQRHRETMAVVRRSLGVSDK